MAFRYTPGHRDEYFESGLTVLKGLIPASLLGDLRHETDTAREIARQKQGGQAQRLQPVYAYDTIDPRPFRDFLTLQALRETVDKILGPDHAMTANMGVLLEPAEQAWCTNWHRDLGHHIANMDMALFHIWARNPRLFNQLNGALYDDHSLWIVPGSHDREDTPEERAAVGRIPAPGPLLTEAMSSAERELACTQYARLMPGAVQVVLQAGDVAFYRACGWHLGSYIPYTRRATLHDGFYGAEDVAVRDAVREMQANRIGA
jgi:hypothetical protein